jgi:hypothetical protein
MSIDLTGRAGSISLRAMDWGSALYLAIRFGWRPEGAHCYREGLFEEDDAPWPAGVPMLAGAAFDRRQLDPAYMVNRGFRAYIPDGEMPAISFVTDEDAWALSIGLSCALRHIVASTSAGTLPLPLVRDAFDPAESDHSQLMYFSNRTNFLQTVIGFTAVGAFDIS